MKATPFDEQRRERVRVPLHHLQKIPNKVSYWCPKHRIWVYYEIRYSHKSKRWVARYRRECDKYWKVLFRHFSNLWWGWDGASVPELVITEEPRKAAHKFTIEPLDRNTFKFQRLPKKAIQLTLEQIDNMKGKTWKNK